MSITSRWRERLRIRRSLEKRARRRYIWHPTRRNKQTLTKRREQVAAAERVLARRRPVTLSERAYRAAVSLIGIMEVGGNNAGGRVEHIIREAGGKPSDRPPWCGYFLAYVYDLAGSKLLPDWHAAAVRLWDDIPGVHVIPAASARRGDGIRFTFDHIGMFVGWRRLIAGRYVKCPRVLATHAETIEGNTGATGAVSDSATGGDGVYRKMRPLNLVADYVRITH